MKADGTLSENGMILIVLLYRFILQRVVCKQVGCAEWRRETKSGHGPSLLPPSRFRYSGNYPYYFTYVAKARPNHPHTRTNARAQFLLISRARYMRSAKSSASPSSPCLTDHSCLTTTTTCSPSTAKAGGSGLTFTKRNKRTLRVQFILAFS